MTKTLGQELMRHCSDSNKPEVQKNMDELNTSWENLSEAYTDRHNKLDDAQEAAKAFQEGLDSMNDYMTEAEDQLETMAAVGSDPETVRRQLDNLKVHSHSQTPPSCHGGT